MRTGRVAGGAYQTDGLTGGYRLANRNMDGRLMAVSRHDAAAVIDNGIVAVAGNPACGGNRAGCRCYDRCAGRCRNILALVELAGTEDRMYTPAIGTRIIGVTRKRPGERAACQRCASQIARRTAARRGRAAALLLCGRCCCGCRSSFLRDCSAIWSLTVSISLVMRSYSAFCSFWYACRLFCSAFCCSSLDFSSSALYFRFS